VGKWQFKAYEEKKREPARFIQVRYSAFLQAEEKQLEQRTTQANRRTAIRSSVPKSDWFLTDR
jgi:hypothetical protein